MDFKPYLKIKAIGNARESPRRLVNYLVLNLDFYISLMFEQLLRENIKRFVIQPFTEKEKQAKIRLMANENPFGSPSDVDYNRYSDAEQTQIKEYLRVIKNIETEHIFLGNGSEEAIDLLFRAFCEPAEDNVIICPPTCELYEKLALINNVKIKKANLNENYQLDIQAIANSIDSFTKIIFLCSPNSPTGNSLHFQDIEIILNNFDGIVVLDEAYINFSRQRSFLATLKDYPNLVILQTFSKAWGLAGLRLGMAFANAGIIEVLNCIKPTYNISEPVQTLALKALNNIDLVNQWTKDTVALRDFLAQQLNGLTIVEQTFPSDANFLCVKFCVDANEIHHFLLENGITVKQIDLENCLRISVGTLQENEFLINILKKKAV